MLTGGCSPGWHRAAMNFYNLTPRPTLAPVASRLGIFCVLPFKGHRASPAGRQGQ